MNDCFGECPETARQIGEIVDRKLKALRDLSLSLAMIAFLYGGLYAFAPEPLLRRPLPDGQTSVVIWVEYIFPIWPIMFFAVSVLISLSAIYRRGVLLAHSIAVFAWLFYGGCIIAGALLSRPPTPVQLGITALCAGPVHWFVAKAWSAEGIK